MENKDYINEIIDYLKDDRPIHAYSSMKRYIEHLGYIKDEIKKEETFCNECSQYRSKFVTQGRNCYKRGIDIRGDAPACDEFESKKKLRK